MSRPLTTVGPSGGRGRKKTGGGKFPQPIKTGKTYLYAVRAASRPEGLRGGVNDVKNCAFKEVLLRPPGRRRSWTPSALAEEWGVSHHRSAPVESLRDGVAPAGVTETWGLNTHGLIARLVWRSAPSRRAKRDLGLAGLREDELLLRVGDEVANPV